MILWDRGSYHTVEGTSPAEGLAAGKLDLLLEGHKLRGRFALVRMKGESGKSWLWLAKVKGADLSRELVEAPPRSWTRARVGDGDRGDPRRRFALGAGLDP